MIPIPQDTEASPPIEPAMKEREELFRQFLGLNWLRPENVLFNMARAVSLQAVDIRSPSMDVSCGDGLFSYLAAGGTIDFSFDRFQFLKTEGFYRHEDIHENYERDEYRVPLRGEPRYLFDVGSDYKQSMLDKAAALGFYRRLLLQDNNRPFRIENGAFRTIYSNSLYWVRHIEGCVGECRRMLRPGGRLLLHIISDDILDLSFLRGLPIDGAWMDLIDRGRRKSYQSLHDRQWWERLFHASGFQILDVIPTLSRLHAHLWNIGLRPIAVHLIDMANLIGPGERLRIKRKFCHTMYDLIKPFTRLEITENDAVEYLYVMER